MPKNSGSQHAPPRSVRSSRDEDHEDVVVVVVLLLLLARPPAVLSAAARVSASSFRSLGNLTTLSVRASSGGAAALPSSSLSSLTYVISSSFRSASSAKKINTHHRPRLGRDDPLNLSISLSGGKETNRDSLSNGE